MKLTFALLATILFSYNSYAQINFKAIFSTRGQVTFSIPTEEFVLEIDTTGKVVSFTARDFGPITYGPNGRIEGIDVHKVNRDHKNRISSIGNSTIGYDTENRIILIGNTTLHYDFVSKRLAAISNHQIEYDFLYGRVTKIATASINYNMKGEIINIDDKDRITSLRITSKAIQEL